MKVRTKRVRDLRHGQTEAERAAWYLLRNRATGLKFRRQYPIGDYVVDFYCFDPRLAIELDGGAHSQPSQIRKDRAKDAFLRSIGIKVLRLPNGLVLQDPEAFVCKIRESARDGMTSQRARERPLTRPATRDTLSPRRGLGGPSS